MMKKYFSILCIYFSFINLRSRRFFNFYLVFWRIQTVTYYILIFIAQFCFEISSLILVPINLLEENLIVDVNWFQEFDANRIHNYWHDYFSFIYVNGFICCVIMSLLISLSILLSPKNISLEKASAYECGFETTGGISRESFKVQYFIVGILYMIFEVEISFLLVCVVNIGTLTITSLFLILFFVFILVLGLIYEWKRGALDWS